MTGQQRYRLRQERYRILYSIQDDELTVRVTKVGHRLEERKKSPQSEKSVDKEKRVSADYADYIDYKKQRHSELKN